MRIHFAVFLVMLLNNALGQDSIIRAESLPKGLTASVNNVNKPCDFKGIKCIGTATFSYLKKRVSYDVFNYTPTDSLIFEKIKWEHLTMENCGWNGKKKLTRNNPGNFIKGEYFFWCNFALVVEVKDDVATSQEKLINGLGNKTAHNKMFMPVWGSGKFEVLFS